MDIWEKVASLAKRRGFIFPGSEIYGGLAGTWDYGPLGAELKRNIKNEFWRSMVQERSDVVGLDAAIIMNPKVWEASGHLTSFSDPLVECKKCHARFREDEIGIPNGEFRISKDVKCPTCGASDWTEPKQFNLMVETYLGVIEGEKQKTYLRGEITQGVHVNFKNVLSSTRVKIPFGVAQIGKAFRNEITPGGFTFRSREFEQMELQYYVRPDLKQSMEVFEYWKKKRMDWYVSLGMKEENLRLKEHAKDELAHYAKAAFDIEYNAEGEWKEMEGIHHRGDWDVRRHQEFSGEDMAYFDEETKEKFLPHIIETSGGVDRATLFFLMNAYEEEKVKEGETRTVLHVHPRLAPYKAAVFPLLANKPDLVKTAKKIYDDLKKDMMVAWDDRGNIGKRYRTQDEAGTPFCVTVDFDSLEQDDVTVRDRDTMRQERVKIGELEAYLKEHLR
ncbi:glycine--tRNA ligase [Patescibacteria group bacterium]|nr:glycine--tRNA ligase [Patescibacteria group bacterium]MCL5114650.1 glycine--tRNA ligase [Patescibacteria group bacterium]